MSLSSLLLQDCPISRAVMVIDPVKWQSLGQKLCFLSPTSLCFAASELFRTFTGEFCRRTVERLDLLQIPQFDGRFLNISGKFLNWLVRYRDQPLREASAGDVVTFIFASTDSPWLDMT